MRDGDDDDDNDDDEKMLLEFLGTAATFAP